MEYLFDRTLGFLPAYRESKHNGARALRFKARSAKRLARQQARP